ncbi:hypothetical protein [Klebsiella variicola]|uniref:hypothetical protein n=1 Tax=Klebsiella variicola TaxID=244366 RepID=UPI00255FF882|nr:hypothetical protein [Klebsiella variicola]MDL3989533.1 hypothetical protein [Klebsiella variicola]
MFLMNSTTHINKQADEITSYTDDQLSVIAKCAGCSVEELKYSQHTITKTKTLNTPVNPLEGLQARLKTLAQGK